MPDGAAISLTPACRSARTLDPAALGVALVAALAPVWVTSLAYLAVRGGLPSPVRLAVVDLVHLYLGVAFLALVGLKSARVGFSLRVRGEPEPAPRRRWLSWGLVVLWAGVGVTGALILVPFPGGLRADLVDGHLIAAVWATVPTTVHLATYRRRALTLITKPWRQRGRRVTGGFGLLLLPLVAGLALAPSASPRAVSPLAQQGAGGAWAPAGPRPFLDRLAVAPGSGTLVAGGAGLYLARAGATNRRWARVGPFTVQNLVIGLDLPARGPVRAWAGTVQGLWAAHRLRGPYRRVSLPANTVHAVAADPGRPRVVWASSLSGFWRSTDGGRTWTREDAGVGSPSTTWALAWFKGSLYGSASRHVYRWNGRRWLVSSDQYGVVMLDPAGRRLFASSMGDGIRLLERRRWQPAQAGLLVHDQGAIRGIHVVSVTTSHQGLAYAGTMVDGIAVSLDGGRTWARTWPGLSAEGVVWRVLPVGDQLLAATDHGLFAYRVPDGRGPTALWWVAVVGVALMAGASGGALAAGGRAQRPGTW
jgi:hypothetical protein